MKHTGLFPFKKIREGQKQFYKDAKESTQSGNHLIAYAPTGIGKTAAALSASLESALKNNKTVLFLTSKQSQHKIAVDTLKLIKNKGFKFSVVDVISKQSMCPRKEARDYFLAFNQFCKLEQKERRCRLFLNKDPEIVEIIEKNIFHVEELKDLCSKAGVCPHKTALDAAKDATIIICDYNYIFSDIAETILPRIEKSLSDIILIIDEAHNLPDRIRNNLSSELSFYVIDEAISEARKIDPFLNQHLKGIKRIMQNIAKEQKDKEIPIKKDEFLEKIEGLLKRTLINILSFDEFVEKLDECAEVVLKKEHQSYIETVADFLRVWKHSDISSSIYYLKDDKHPHLFVKLLDPSILSKDVFESVYSSIMMSGTLYPMEMYLDILGLEKKRTKLSQYSSPFPKENRKIIVTDNLSTLYRLRGEEMYKKYAESIENVQKVTKGITAVFTPSYDIMQNISLYLSTDLLRKAVIEEKEMSKKEKDEMVKNLSKLKNKGGVLLGVLGGSLSEGVDYSDNILGCVFVAGVPFAPSKSIETNELKRYYQEIYGKNKGRYYSYIYPAINKVLQGAGRGIRNEKDRGVIILGDKRFSQGNYLKCFPPDFDFIETKKPWEEIKDFFLKKEPVRRFRKHSSEALLRVFKNFTRNNNPNEKELRNRAKMLSEIGFEFEKRCEVKNSLLCYMKAREDFKALLGMGFEEVEERMMEINNRIEYLRE